VVVACSEPTELEPWQLDHDRVIAVRATPPHIAPGEIALFDALVAHADGPTTIGSVYNAAAPFAPADLYTAVHYYFDHWQIDGPDQARLDVARVQLGLPADAPVPLEVTLELPGPLYAYKTVWLGDSRANPPAPTISHGPVLAIGSEYPLAFDAPPGGSVRWLTSCGTLRDDTESHATHIVDDACEGELVVVVRDGFGGVAWQVLPIRVE
jgi:hypothetical protein